MNLLKDICGTFCDGLAMRAPKKAQATQGHPEKE